MGVSAYLCMRLRSKVDFLARSILVERGNLHGGYRSIHLAEVAVIQKHSDRPYGVKRPLERFSHRQIGPIVGGSRPTAVGLPRMLWRHCHLCYCGGEWEELSGESRLNAYA